MLQERSGRYAIVIEARQDKKAQRINAINKRDQETGGGGGGREWEGWRVGESHFLGVEEGCWKDERLGIRRLLGEVLDHVLQGRERGEVRDKPVFDGRGRRGCEGI